MRFIRDIIDEKKNATLTKAPEDFDACGEAEIANQGRTIAAVNPLSHDAAEPMPTAVPTSAPTDDQALRNIFKTETGDAPTPRSDVGHPELQEETSVFDQPHESIGEVPNPADHMQDEVVAPERHEAEIDQTRYVAPAGSTVPEEPYREARMQPPAVEEVEAPDQPVEVPQPAAGRMLCRSGRVKTRVLGFGQPHHTQTNVFNSTETQAASTPTTHPVGWLVVVNGPGTGSAFTLFSGVSSIGRGPDQTVPLAFGDNSISRENHAAVAYDAEQSSFYLGHGGKTNLVRLNNRPVLSTEQVHSGDEIRIGETTLRFIALCGEQFSWSTYQTNGVTHDAAH
ncbi:MAG: FHA domain-containing protein [Pseudomonadota bacterium]